MLTGRRSGGSARDVRPGDDHAPLLRRLESGDEIEQRRLAAARGADHRGEGGIRKRGVETHLHVFIAEGDVVERDHR